VDGVDDLGVVDPAEIGGGDPEIGMAQLALDDDQRDPLAGHLNSVGVPQLMRRESAADSGCLGSVA
jgi:hypothetical protein